MCARRSIYSSLVKQSMKRHFHSKYPLHGKGQGTSIVRREELKEPVSSLNTIRRAKNGRLSRADRIQNCVNMSVLEKIPLVTAFATLPPFTRSLVDITTINAAKVRSFVIKAAKAVHQRRNKS